MANRRGMGAGMGRGYRNIIGKDPKVHSQSARGMKQPQCIKQFIGGRMDRLTSLKMSVMIAYGDAWRGTGVRNLDYASPPMKPNEAKEVIKVITNYNDFWGKKASRVIGSFNEKEISEVVIAREGSVGIYMTIPSWYEEGNTRKKYTNEEKKTIAEKILSRFVGEEMPPDEYDLVDSSRDTIGHPLRIEDWEKGDWNINGVRLWWD